MRPLLGELAQHVVPLAHDVARKRHAAFEFRIIAGETVALRRTCDEQLVAFGHVQLVKHFTRQNHAKRIPNLDHFQSGMVLALRGRHGNVFDHPRVYGNNKMRGALL
jgi:hypothetical protein